jgi:hypothetical protein
MFSKTPFVRINKVERIEITTPFHPFWEEIFFHYFKRLYQQSSPYAVWPFVQPLPLPSQLPGESEKEEPPLLKGLDYAGRGVSILSGIAVIVFVALLWSGQATIGSVQIGTLLTIVSFTFIGGLISIGGVKMFSINASLRKAKERIEQVITTAGGCPFLAIFAGEPTELRRPGNPYFCAKCPLGIDIDSRKEGSLIHVCNVYPVLHRQWKELPGADEVLRR